MQTIFFDVDGVLINGYHARPELRVRWHENLQEDFGIDPDYFSSTFFVDPFSSDILMGKMDLKEALSAWLRNVGYHGDVQFFMDYWLKKDSNLNLDLIEAIKKMKGTGQVKLFIATNQAHNRAAYLMETLGLEKYFEGIFYSARMGVMKPDREYFEYISDELELKAGEKPILFDDTPTVLEAANSMGWQAYEYLNIHSLSQSPFVKNLLNIQG